MGSATSTAKVGGAAAAATKGGGATAAAAKEKWGVVPVVGKNLDPSQLDLLNEEQLGQLLELKRETTKPLDSSVL